MFVIEGDTPPTTVKVAHDTPEAHEAEDVATDCIPPWALP